ncbi:MAG TPA: HAMP domain-containing sensor histidine kinase [Bacteroidales bacterium]|nr:HAMP domain-containing sensor histidine kinase [Bacteroidales bacterium]
MIFLNKKRYYVYGIVVSTIVITYLHYSTSLGEHALHSIYAELYYIPILIAAFLGLKAALLTYLFVSALYLPFVFLSWAQSLFLVDKLLHLLFTGFFAFLAGFLIDSLRRYQKQLEQDKIELQKLDRLKSSFLANVSHELRTPMTAVTGYTDLLLDRVDGPVNEEQERSLKKIASHSKNLLALINNMLDVAKMEAGEKVGLDFKDVNLKGLIDSLMPIFEPLIKQKGLMLTINIDENVSSVYGDEDRIKQVLTNLLSNAIKFTHQGGITITSKLSTKGITQNQAPLFAEVCIEDTGIGIKDEDINKIFNKFVQVDPSLKRQYEGTGLGLSVAKGFIALHKGELWVKSKYGEGSKFCFTLKLNKEVFESHNE